MLKIVQSNNFWREKILTLRIIEFIFIDIHIPEFKNESNKKWQDDAKKRQELSSLKSFGVLFSTYIVTHET